MKKSYFFLLILFTITFFSCKTEKEIKLKTTVLIGEVIDRDSSKTVSLIKKSGKHLVSSIKIPIRNGKFSHIIHDEFIQEYELAFDDELEIGSWRPIKFFNDKDTVKLNLHTKENYIKNNLIGGDLNNKVTFLNKEAKTLFQDKINHISFTKIDSLIKNNKWNSNEVASLYKQLNATEDYEKRRKIYEKLNNLRKNKKDLSVVGRFWKNKVDSINYEYNNWKNNTIDKDTSLVGYTMIIDKLYYSTDYNLLFIEKKLKKYHSKYKNHPYTSMTKNIINGIKNAKVNGYYSDFKSNTYNNEIIKVSSIIPKNKLTLIDLWTTWCAPCISKDKELVPYYENLKKKGFEVFSVVNLNSKEEYLTANDKYKYPWKVNYEINYEYNIWHKYNISRSGGSQFLVNSKGKILAINPEPKEIDSILNSMVKIKF